MRNCAFSATRRLSLGECRVLWADPEEFDSFGEFEDLPSVHCVCIHHAGDSDCPVHGAAVVHPICPSDPSIYGYATYQECGLVLPARLEPVTVGPLPLTFWLAWCGLILGIVLLAGVVQ